MHVSMTLPQSVLGSLRQGAYLALQSPIEGIAEILSGEGSHDRHKASLIDSHARLMQVRLLLDAIGWCEGEALTESTIDLAEHGAGFATALDNAIKIALEDVDHPDRQVRQPVYQAMYELCGFAAVIDKTDIERSQYHPCSIHKHAAQLLSELEREAAKRPQPHPTTN